MTCTGKCREGVAVAIDVGMAFSSHHHCIVAVVKKPAMKSSVSTLQLQLDVTELHSTAATVLSLSFSHSLTCFPSSLLFSLCCGAEIRSAYRKLSLKVSLRAKCCRSQPRAQAHTTMSSLGLLWLQWHPDKNPAPGAKAKFVTLATAMEVLSGNKRPSVVQAQCLIVIHRV